MAPRRLQSSPGRPQNNPLDDPKTFKNQWFSNGFCTLSFLSVLMASSNSYRIQLRAQYGPRRPQGGSKTTHDGPKTSQVGPKTAPRPPKTAPRWPQDGQAAPKTPPRRPKMGSRGTHDGPRGNPRWPQDGHDGSKTAQAGPNITPLTAPKPSKTNGFPLVFAHFRS